MKIAKVKFGLSGLTSALSAGIFSLALFILAFSFALPASAAGTVTVTEVHDYLGAVDTRAPRSVATGETNLIDWYQPTYDGFEYELESITVERTILPYTIIFNANGGAPTPSAQTVEHGKTASKPADPVRNGYAFAGWYTAADFSGSAWNFDNDIVTGDMTLYAKWTPETYYIVVFVANGGTPVPAYQTVLSGQTVIKPTDPVRDGYAFAGWYITWDFSGPIWDFNNNIVTGNTILYARWILPNRSLSKTDPGIDDTERKVIIRNPEMELDTFAADTFTVSLYQPPSPLSATTVWKNGQPEDDARFIFEEGNEYRITYYYKAAEPNEPSVYTVTEMYQNQSGNAISATTVTQVAPDNKYIRTAPVISGYTFTGAILNGVTQPSPTVVISSVFSDYTLVFTYTSTATGYQPIPSAQLFESDAIFDDSVIAPFTSSSQPATHQIKLVIIVGAILLLCCLAGVLFTGKNGE